MIHLNKLTDELRAAGLSGDCASDGRVDFGPGDFWRPGDPITKPWHEVAARVVAAHDPNPTYAELRAAEYAKQGLTAETLVIALWERVIEGRPEAAAAIQAKREAVKAQFPKPEIARA